MIFKQASKQATKQARKQASKQANLERNLRPYTALANMAPIVCFKNNHNPTIPCYMKIDLNSFLPLILFFYPHQNAEQRTEKIKDNKRRQIESAVVVSKAHVQTFRVLQRVREGGQAKAYHLMQFRIKAISHELSQHTVQNMLVLLM